ncbi:MAG: M28 family peptidase [Saprospiraceae bacterium]
MKYLKYNWLVLLLVLAFSACDNVEKPSTGGDVTDKPAKKILKVPSFDANNAYDMVAKQVAFGPRVPNTEGHKATSKWLVETLKETGAKVYEQDFVATTYYNSKLQSKNIIASFNPDNAKRVLLCAHWDTRHIADHDEDESRQDEPILGADDSGSGVGVLLEIARVLGQDSSFKMGVDIVLFDSEDHGAPNGDASTADSWGLGAQYWSKSPHIAGYRAEMGILLDMVGSKSPRFTKEGTSMRYAPTIMNKVWDIASAMGYGGFFDATETSGLTDDHYFVNTIAGIPTIDIINRDLSTYSNFGAHWHTHNDNMDIIGKGTLKAVGEVVLNVVYKNAAGEF